MEKHQPILYLLVLLVSDLSFKWIKEKRLLEEVGVFIYLIVQFLIAIHQ